MEVASPLCSYKNNLVVRNHFKQKNIIRLNVGGTVFTTSLSTLTTQETFFSGLLSGRFEMMTDETGAYFIDRDPRNFNLILNYLRGQEVFFDDLSIGQLRELASDCEFYQVQGFLKLLVERGFVEIEEEQKSIGTRELVFQSDRDSNGILYWLGVDKGKSEEWMNPAHRGYVQVSASSVMYGDPSSIVGRDFEEGASKYGLESWFQVYFRDIQVRPTCYTINLPKTISADPGIAKTWEFQGSNDGVSWSVISRLDANNNLLAGKFPLQRFWKVECRSFFTYFRVFHTAGDWTLHRTMFAIFEIYGEVKDVNPGKLVNAYKSM